jgi:hypothetical protein
MALAYNTRSKVPVPENTIKSKWDAYTSPLYQGENISEKYDINQIGGAYHNKHTGKKCTRRILGKCRKYVYPGSMSSAKVPIGAWAEAYDGQCFTGSVTNRFDYPSDVLGEKLSDDTATRCAGGSSLGYHEFLTKDSKTNIDNTSDITSNECIVGSVSVSRPNIENCFVSGIQYPVFCQMGDYIATNDECKRQCDNSTSLNNANNYCNWSYDRLCGKVKGEAIKRDAKGKLIQSDRNWITDPICEKYCGGPRDFSNKECRENKGKYCSTPSSWPNAGEYCLEFWKTFPNVGEMDKACKQKLINDPIENIATGVGCSSLCRGAGLDVDNKWCNEKRLEYCRDQNNKNLFNPYCYRFCKDQPDLCAQSLRETCGEFVSNMDDIVPGTQLKYHNFCGCLQDEAFYENYKNKILGSIQDRGYEITPSEFSSNPKCIYPTCTNNSIMTTFQQSDECSGEECVMDIIKNYSYLYDTDIEKCTIFKLPSSTSSEPPPTTSFEPPPTTSMETSMEIPPTTSFETPPTTSFEPPPTTSMETSMEIPPTTSFEPPPRTSMEPPPRTSMEIPPRTSMETSMEIPPRTSMEIPPRTSMEIPPRTSMEIPPEIDMTKSMLSGGSGNIFNIGEEGKILMQSEHNIYIISMLFLVIGCVLILILFGYFIKFVKNIVSNKKD